MGNSLRKFVLFCSCLVFIAAINGVVEAAEEFQVGGEFGWQEPDANNSGVYNQWAEMNGFQIGDTLSFRYQNDSVLVVNKYDYYHCITTKPISSFNNGETIIKLDNTGPFYFISGDPGRCKNGQHLLVDVLGSVTSPPESNIIVPAPAPSSSVLVSVVLSLVFVGILFSCLCLFCCSP